MFLFGSDAGSGMFVAPFPDATPKAQEVAMPRMVRKGDLPTRICAGCGRPFAWRRKWAKDWNQVRYCSDKCRAAKAPKAAPDQ